MTVLLVDDDPTLRAMLCQAFELENVAVNAFGDPAGALSTISPDFSGVVVTDVWMPEMDGLTLFARVHAIDPEIPVIVMTGHADVPMVIDALKRGVFDFIPKPFATDHLLATVRRAAERRALVLENRALRALATRAEEGEPLIGNTPVMVRLRDTIRQLATAPVDVLIEGETGTGKELAALLLHRCGPRRAKPFVAVNCAALPPGLAEAELFGYAPGVHAQYRGGHPGRIAAAHGGILFLDEVGSMPAAVQGALLRVIEEREVAAIGDDRPRPIDIRVVAATNVDLVAAAAAGSFRKDLLYRLNAVHLQMPPMRERIADVPLLFAWFLKEASERTGTPIPSLGRDIHAYLVRHSWPGNARELRSYAQRVLLGLHGDEADEADADSLPDQIAQFEAGLIQRALERSGGDILATQEKLGIARNTLYDKLKRYGIRPAAYRR